MSVAAGLLENRTLLEKADLAISDLSTNGGYLVDEQAAAFIRLLIDQSVIMPAARVVPMKAPKKLIEKIRFASRILRPGAERIALAVGDRSAPNTSKVELDAKLFKAEVRLSDEDLEDNIERAALQNTIKSLMTEAIARDMDEIIVQGDTTSADTFLAQMDGMLKAATSNVYAAGTVNLDKSILKAMVKAMPSPFLRNRNMMRFFTSIDAELDYRDSISNRATPQGDAALSGAAPVGYGGTPVVPVPLFPENLGGGTNETDVILTDPKNIAVGIWRQIRLETDKDISKGDVIVVGTVRFDFKYVEETAVVKSTGVKVT